MIVFDSYWRGRRFALLTLDSKDEQMKSSSNLVGTASTVSASLTNNVDQRIVDEPDVQQNRF